MLSLDFMLFPLIDDMEENLKASGEIGPKVMLMFAADSYRIIGQFRQIEGLPAPAIVPTPFPAKTVLIVTREEGDWRATEDNHFHEPISFVYASQLRDLNVDDPIGHNQAPPVHHKAIKAFLDALPDDTRIALWWD